MTQKNAILWCRRVFYAATVALTLGTLIVALTIWGDGWLRPSDPMQTVGLWMLAVGTVIAGTAAGFLLVTDRS